MSETIGRIEIPETVLDTSTPDFPFVTDYPHGLAIARQVISHSFGDPRVEQRFYQGDPAARYTYHCGILNHAERLALVAFWQATEGGTLPFYYGVPQEDQTFVTTTVRFENTPLTLEDFISAITSSGVTFVEIPDPALAPEYVSDTGGPLTRFPDTYLAEALLDEVQEIIPLVHIRVSEAAVDDIYLSDRRVTVDGNLYQPRLLRIGEPDSSVLMSQSINGDTDEVQFSFGNADRVMIQLANDTELKWAEIELSLYHVQTGYLLNLWAGLIVDWSSDKGPEFVVQASDRLSALTLQSPVGTCSRSCWKRYGIDCPATIGTQALDLVHFPSADADWCDLGYDTDNGCLAHSGGANPTKYSFGGTYGHPQQVRISDTSTGLWGMWRDTITPTSQIADTYLGQSLPEIWHNDDGLPQLGLPVTCRIVSGREESDFYNALGIVGRGLLGAFTVAQMVDLDSDGTKETFIGSTLDGQPHHGWRVDDDGNPTASPPEINYGLRQVLGADPAGATDFFSLDRTGTSPLSWREVVSGSSVLEDDFAAGVAFMVMRRVDEKGVQLSLPSTHTMVAMISQGLTGWTWSALGVRSALPGCTNPFWVAINTYLLATGLYSSSSALQLAKFDMDAAVTCAADADTYVDKLFGVGTEKQFRFKGTIDPRQPTRDHIRDILNNGLGYFTWSFGKLRLGIKISATSVTSFHAGNMLFGSLKLKPIEPKFEKLTVEFADEEYLYAHNTIDYCDQDYAARSGRIQNPLASQFGLVGCATKSQAVRIAVVRTREELGGVGETEQKQARIATWNTTIMALDTEAGMVVNVIDDDLPNGAGAFRIQSWQLNRDWSVSIVAKTVTDSMYDLTVGTVPRAISETVNPPITPTRDNGLPPTPTFSVRVSPTDPSAIEIYNLVFSQTTNTRTIESATFTVSFDDTSQPDQVFTTYFPPDFFSGAGASGWALQIPLPNMNVISVSGFVTNRYGNSESYTELFTGLSLSASDLHGFSATFDGGGSALTAGLTCLCPPVANGGTISAWNIRVNAGTATIKVWKVPRGSANPTAGDSINTAGVSISSGEVIHETDCSDFLTLDVADGDLVTVSLEAVSGATKVVFSVELS